MPVGGNFMGLPAVFNTNHAMLQVQKTIAQSEIL